MTSLVERMVAPANNFLDHIADLEERVQRLERYPDAGSDGSAAALADESYLVLNLSTDLSNERVLTISDGLTGTDNGAGSTFVLALGTPSSVSVLSTNVVTGATHEHAVISSSNPGATQVILATDLDGGIQLLRLGIGTDPDTDNAVKVIGGTWVGLDSAAGRIVFADLVTDQVQLAAADLYLPTGLGIIHADGVTAGQYLRADGTRYVPNTIQAGDLPGSFSGFANPTGTVGLAVVDGVLTTAMRSDAAPPLSQAIIPTWTQLHTYTAGLKVSDDQDLTFGTDNNTTIRYDEAGDNRMEVAGADWLFSVNNFGITSAASTMPTLLLENTNGDNLAQVIQFYKNSATPADNDDIGAVDFYGETSTGAQERYAYILSESLDVTNGDTGGSLRFVVVMDAAERNVLEIKGYNGVVNQGSVVINEDAQDVDFVVEAVGVADALQVQGSDGNVGIGYKLSLTEYMDHIGDVDTYLRFQADNITIRAGGADLIDCIEGATDYVNFPAGLVFINETANAFMTRGLTITDADTHSEMFTLKDTSVAHGMTAITDTNTFLHVKLHSTYNGTILRGLSPATVAMNLIGSGVTDDATKTTASTGYIALTAQKKNLTDVGACGADANLVVITNHSTTEFIFDAEGSAHANVEWTTFDAYNDLALLADLETAMLAQHDPVKAQFANFLRYNRTDLERAGIVHFDDTPGRAMVNFTRLSMLLVGALQQVGQRLGQVERLLPAN